MFDKVNLKIFLIWPISFFLTMLLRVFGHLNPEVLLINDYHVLLLVFGPAIVVTMVIVLKRFLNSWYVQEFKLYGGNLNGAG